MAKLQQCLEQNVVLMIVGDQNVIDYFRQILVGITRDVAFVRIAQHWIEKYAHVGRFEEYASVTKIPPARGRSVVLLISPRTLGGEICCISCGVRRAERETPASRRSERESPESRRWTKAHVSSGTGHRAARWQTAPSVPRSPLFQGAEC